MSDQKASKVFHKPLNLHDKAIAGFNRCETP